MVMYTENDTDSKDVLIISTLPNNSLEDAITVRIINNQNKSDTSFFYTSGNPFPSKMTIAMDGETLTGEFSAYNGTTETFSATFSDGDETEAFEDLILNKNVFTAHEDDDRLTDTQNVRYRAILTTLALWTSIAIQIGNGSEINALSRGFSWGNFFTGALAVVAVAAVIALVIVSLPAAVSIVGAAINVSLVTTPQIVLASVAGRAAIGAGVLSMLPENERPSKSPPPYVHPPPYIPPTPTPPTTIDKRPIITITHKDVPLENNGRLYYLAPPTATSPGESITFDVKIISTAGFSVEEIMNVNEIFAYNPADKEFVTVSPKIDSNASFFIKEITRKELPVIIFQIKLSKRWSKGVYSCLTSWC